MSKQGPGPQEVKMPKLKIIVEKPAEARLKELELLTGGRSLFGHL